MTKKKSRNSVKRHKLAPPTTQRAPVIKIKKKPRGRPFEKGNRFGLVSRFRRGEPSPNPAGRPSFKKQNEACRDRLAQTVPRHELLAAKLPAHLFGMSYAELNAWILEQEGIRGNVSAIAEIADRAEGRPGVSLQLDDTNPDPLTLILLELKAQSDKEGLPEGMQPRLESVNSSHSSSSSAEAENEEMEAQAQ